MVREATHEKILKRSRAAFVGTEQGELIKDINNVPASWRRKSDGKSARAVVCEWAKSDEPIPEHDPDNGYELVMIEAAHALRNRRKAIAEIGAYFPSVRINGEAPAIRKRVAEEATKKFGVHITPVYVKRVCDDRNGDFNFDD